MNDQQAQQLITALNNLEQDIERLSVAIEHWEAVNTARDASDESMTAADAMSNRYDEDNDIDVLSALEEHYAEHDVPVELDEVNGKIYVEPLSFVGEDTFRELFGNDRVKYDKEAPRDKQNWIWREDVKGYIRETS